jgi:hypothetical protein
VPLLSDPAVTPPVPDFATARRLSQPIRTVLMCTFTSRGWYCTGSQNHDGILVIRATALSDDSTPARISRMAADAQVPRCMWTQNSGIECCGMWHALVAICVMRLHETVAVTSELDRIGEIWLLQQSH